MKLYSSLLAVVAMATAAFASTELDFDSPYKVQCANYPTNSVQNSPSTDCLLDPNEFNNIGISSFTCETSGGSSVGCPLMNPANTEVIEDKYIIDFNCGTTVNQILFYFYHATFSRPRGNMNIKVIYADGSHEYVSFSPPSDSGQAIWVDIYKTNVVRIEADTTQGKVALCGIKYHQDCGSGGGGGDPHFFRFQGSELSRPRDSFHGECDLVLVQSNGFHKGAGFELYARTTIHSFYSYIESAALRIGEDILEVSGEQIHLNGELAQTPVRFGGGEYVYELVKHAQPQKTVYELQVNGETLITYRAFQHYLTVAVARWNELADTRGLLGRLSDGEMITRDNEIFNGPFDEFAFEWQVNTLSGDSSLFVDAERSPQLPYETCRMPTAARPARRALRANSGLYEKAKAACAEVVTNDSDLALCVDDVLVTGELGMAAVW